MKNLEIPVMSKEERQRYWDNLKEGDVLVRIDYTCWGSRYTISYLSVVRKTGKGSIRLKDGTLLKYFGSNYHILTEKLKEWIKSIQLEDEIIHLFYEVDRNKDYFKSNLEYEDAIKLKEILKRTIKKEGV